MRSLPVAALALVAHPAFAEEAAPVLKATGAEAAITQKASAITLSGQLRERVTWQSAIGFDGSDPLADLV